MFPYAEVSTSFRGQRRIRRTPPVSELIACLLFVRSQVASGEKASEILSVTHSVCVPLLSLSRYLCTSKIRFVVLLSGLVTLRSAAPSGVSL